MAKYFGTDGIRGKAHQTLTYELAYKVGKALRVLNSKEVVVATDTRESKDELEKGIIDGATSVGLDVIRAGILPTPGLVYYSMLKKITGIMITASHNPYTDNGIKVLDAGVKINEKQEDAIEELFEKDGFESKEIGKVIDGKEVVEEYLKFLKKHACISAKRIALDMANGATYQTAPTAFSLVDDLLLMGNTPDGFNINRNVGSTHLDSLKKFVIENNCELGFAFDGDGDRVLVVDGNGKVFDGDMIMYIIANDLHKKGKLTDNKVVFTIMSNLGLIKALKNNGIDVIETSVGDKYVVRELLNNGYSIGGENSGHIIMTDILQTGDGTLVALTLLRVLEETKMTLDELTKDIHMYADLMVNLTVNDKKVLNKSVVENKINEIKKKLGSDGKVIVRPSGTEDFIRISVMAYSADIVREYVDEIVDLVKREDEKK